MLKKQNKQKFKIEDMKLRTDLTLRKLGDEYVIVDPGQDMIDMSKVYTLNETAALLWESLQNKDFDVKAILKILMDEFDVEIETAKRDAKILVQKFREHGLLIE